MTRTSSALLIAAASLVGLGGCGKDHEEGPDLRKPPPKPAAGGPSVPKSPPATAGAPAPAPGAPATPGVPVKVAKPVKKTVALTVDYTGQTTGSETVEIRARVEGFLKSMHYAEGTFVKPGDLLFEIDKDKANEIVEQAEGVRDVAIADMGKADQDVARNQPLVEKNAISREEYETSVSAAKAAKARVEAAEAAVRRAKINLGYATVRAPVEGLIGKSEVDVGNLVGKGEPTLLTTISKIDPILVEIRVSETDLLEYQKKKQAGSARAVSDLTLFFSDGAEYAHKGEVSMIDRNIDVKTGTLLVRVSFPNPDKTVRPGQFARVQGVRERVVDALLVPPSAVEELQGSFRVLVVDASNTVRVKTVKAGVRRGKLWMIDEGLQADDRVVVEGRQKVRDGSKAAPTEMTIDDDGNMKEVPGAPAPGGPAPGEPAGGEKPDPSGMK